jgi:hypothetical protein
MTRRNNLVASTAAESAYTASVKYILLIGLLGCSSGSKCDRVYKKLEPLMKAETQAGRSPQDTLGGLCVERSEDQSAEDCILDLDTPTLADVESCRRMVKKKR